MADTILVIGAGPVGLSLALALTHRNIRVEVYEALPTLSREDRASTLHPPTLEMFSEWGILGDVLSRGQIVMELQYWRRDIRQLVAAFDYRLISEFTPYPYRLHLSQGDLTHLLLAQLGQTSLAMVHFDHRLQHFEQHDSHVSATFHTPDGEKVVEGAYLCGADGGRSAVRKHLGIDFRGRSYEDRFLLVDSDARLNGLFKGIGPISYIFDAEEWVIIQQMPDYVRFTFRVRSDEDIKITGSRSGVYRRIDRFAPNLAHHIRQARTYGVQQRVAAQFYQGRVALLGDAAHLTNPIGGKGLNSGIHDAHLLAAVLAAILKGKSSPERLEDYSRVRRQVALERINASSENDYADMTAFSHHAIISRDEKFKVIASSLRLARDFLLRASMLETRIPEE